MGFYNALSNMGTRANPAVTTYYDGAIRSVDRGQSWEPVNEGLATVG